MAEVLGVVASGISIGSLAIQLVDSVQQILDIWSSIKGAPENVQDLLEELRILGELLSELTENGDEQAVPTRKSLLLAAQYCKKAIASVDKVLKDLADGIASSKGRTRNWSAIKAAVKDKVLERSMSRLERAKSLLVLARQCYTSDGLLSLELKVKHLQDSQSQRLQVIEEMLSTTHRPSIHTSVVMNDSDGTPPSLIARSNGSNLTRWEKNSSTNKSSYWFVLGTLTIHSKTVTSPNTGTDKETCQEYTFRVTRWLSARGYTLLSTPIYGFSRYYFRSYRIFTHNDPIFMACAHGDVEHVRRLCVQGEATPFDTTYHGWTLLHVI